MANRNWQQVYKGLRRQKENMVPVDAKSQNLFSVISDEEALKIHGLNLENNGYLTDSDSGKSDFDEEYFKHKPQPFQINPMNIVTIKSLNTKNEQLQVKEVYEHNAEVKKGKSIIAFINVGIIPYVWINLVESQGQCFNFHFSGESPFANFSCSKLQKVCSCSIWRTSYQ